MRQVLPKPTLSSSAPWRKLRRIAYRRVAELHKQGHRDAYLYGVPGGDGRKLGVSAVSTVFFLLTDRPEVYNLPSAPETAIQEGGPLLPGGCRATALLYGVATAVGDSRGKIQIQ